MEQSTNAMAGAAGPSREKHVYLLGHTPLEELLAFLSKESAEDQLGGKAQATEDWSAAQQYLAGLAITEAGWPDRALILRVPDALQSLAARVLADPIYQKAFASVPSRLGVVELDRLVVRQNLINLAQVERIRERLLQAPRPEDIFRLCLPFDHPTTAYRSRIGESGSIEFISESNDLRFLEAVVLRPEQVAGYQPLGPVAGVAGLVIGYGSNYLNVIAAEDRLVLNNGSHRAYALRELGISRVPCVVQEVQRREDLQRVGAGTLRRNPDLHLKHVRPPLLKDYFDPRLIKILHLVRAVRHVKIRYTIETFDTPAE